MFSWFIIVLEMGVIIIYRFLIFLSFLLLIGCDSIGKVNEKENNNSSNSNDKIVLDNDPIIGCNIPTIDKYNNCNVYFENGMVSKIEFFSTYLDVDTMRDKKAELESLFGNVEVKDLSISLVITNDNDKYMEYVGMDKESVGYICR